MCIRRIQRVSSYRLLHRRRRRHRRCRRRRDSRRWIIDAVNRPVDGGITKTSSRNL